jgi:hypothetical protein
MATTQTETINARETAETLRLRAIQLDLAITGVTHLTQEGLTLGDEERLALIALSSDVCGLATRLRDAVVR